jgi:hypothetical protein
MGRDDSRSNLAGKTLDAFQDLPRALAHIQLQDMQTLADVPNPVSSSLEISFAQGVRRVGDGARSDAEEAAEPLPISQEPGFNLPNDDSKAHVRAGCRQPIPHERRGTVEVLIEIDEHEPGRPLGCGVVSGQGTTQVRLAVLDLHPMNGRPATFDDSAQYGLIGWSLDGPRDVHD